MENLTQEDELHPCPRCREHGVKSPVHICEFKDCDCKKCEGFRKILQNRKFKTQDESIVCIACSNHGIQTSFPHTCPYSEECNSTQCNQDRGSLSASHRVSRDYASLCTIEIPHVPLIYRPIKGHVRVKEPKCRFCLPHGLVVKAKNHKSKCEFRNCKCLKWQFAMNFVRQPSGAPNAYLQASEKEKEEARQQNYARQVHLKSLDLLCLAEDMDRPFVIRVNRLSAAGTSGQLPQSGSMANDASTLIGNLGTENTINNSEKRKFASAFDSEDSEDSSKPMSFDEKCHLSSDFGKLSSFELSVVIQILKSKEPIMRDLDPCGIVIDFERLKQSTLRKLESCVAFYIGNKTDTPS